MSVLYERFPVGKERFFVRKSGFLSGNPVSWNFIVFHKEETMADWLPAKEQDLDEGFIGDYIIGDYI
ncbi:MAG: hypothetical protein LBE17_04580 [Treponema sp.]|jgi:hypothetical protein|nr:hypothetical protein [Treponema sp.]